MDTATNKKKRRQYHRRTPEDRVAEIEQRIAELKAKQAAREKRESPLVKEIPRLQGRLRRFAQLAMDQQRADVSNSVMAFVASLERILRTELGTEELVGPESED